MSSFTQQALLNLKWQPMVQIVRYRRINIQRPRPPHYQRKLVLHVVEPQYERPKKSLQELCLKPLMLTKKKEVTENPFQTLLAREVLNWFNSSRAAFLFHCNSIKAQELYRAKVLFHRQQISLRNFDRDTLKEAFTGNRYETLLPLLPGGAPIIAFASEPNVQVVLKITKKVPQIILLGGIVDNRLLSKSELMEYTKFPDLQSAQAQLVSVLNSTAQQLVQNLTQSQQTLVSHLEKHVELHKSDDK